MQGASEQQGLVTGMQADNQRNMGDESNPCYECSQKCCGVCTGFIKTWICCICCDSPYKTVDEGNVAVIQEFGKFSKLYGPGLYYVNPCTESLVLVDKRERIMPSKGQTVMTKDNVNVIIDAVIYWKIDNSYKSLFSVNDLEFSIIELTHTSLRDVFGVTTLQEALEDREKVADHLLNLLRIPTHNRGVTVKRVLIQEILFTEDLQRTLSSAATAKSQAESKIINAQADVQAAKLMRTASDILNTGAAMQIRYLDSLSNIAKTGNPKVVFFPSDFRAVGSNGSKEMAKMNVGNNMGKR